LAIKRTNLPPRTLITSSTTPGDKIPASGWFRVGQENKARGGAEVRAIAGTGTTVHLGIETATDPRNPDSGYTSMWSAGAASNGMKDPDSALVSVSVAGKLWYRWVWGIFVTSGTGWVSVSGFGEIMDQ
jgi:hypothetical protein